MPKLQILEPNASRQALLQTLEKDGACIIANLLPASLLDKITAEVMPYIERTRFGGDDFSGRRTRRTGALIARSPACRELVLNPTILDAAKVFLAPHTEKILLHLTQTICISPGEGAQQLHRDRLAWGNHLPRSIEPQFNTIWALTDFTAVNGATRVVPGSHRWTDEQRATELEICQAEMSRGSVLVYSGSVIHSGGENHSQEARLGLNLTYCLGWLRQEENQYLSCPPHIARDLPHALQELLGYTMGNYALGYYSDPDNALTRGAGILSPEHAIQPELNPEKSPTS